MTQDTLRDRVASAHGITFDDIMAAPAGTIRWELVTPAKAAEWLSRPAPNRRVKRGTVKNFVKMMKDNKWLRNPQPIIIGTDGRLYNGQHRLKAVVESGVSIWFVIAYETDPKVMAVIDTGKGRNAAEQFGIASGEKQSPLVISLVNANYYLRRGTYLPMSQETIAAWYADNKDTVEWVKGLMKIRTPGLRRFKQPVFGAMAFARLANRNLIEEASVQLIRGTDLKWGDPIQTLRDVLLASNIAYKDERHATGRLVLTALYYRLKDKNFTGKPLVSEEAVEFFRGLHELRLPLASMKRS